MANVSDRTHAVVMGGSVAGLAAAAVLSRHFERVTLFERDPLSSTPVPRRGVPQGAQGHILLESGRLILADLFPGLFDDLLRAGSVRVDMGHDMRWFQFGGWKAKGDVGYAIFSQTRPFLEHAIRARVASLPNVTLRFGEAIDAPIFEGGGVTGVRLRDGDAQGIAADLVVDATGRGSRSRQWLPAWGFAAPEEESVTLKIAYSTRLYRPAAASRPWKTMVVYPMPPHQKRAGYIFPVEDGLWQVTLAGYHGHHPPTDHDGFMAYARELSHPCFAEALAGAEPLTEPVRHTYPKQVRQRYDRLARLPERYAILGDAVCSLDPVFGQGMSVALKGVRALDRQLAQGSFSPRAFQRAVAFAGFTPWLITSAEGHRFPETEGDRVPGMGLLQRYVARVFRQSAHDPAVYRALLGVVHLEKGPHTLVAPATLARVMRPIPTGTTTP
jgi:2-polyprenyl-6-methoxyphenol hydroxylase-like FAD-dependent oxidoreductase